MLVLARNFATMWPLCVLCVCANVYNNLANFAMEWTENRRNIWGAQVYYTVEYRKMVANINSSVPLCRHRVCVCAPVYRVVVCMHVWWCLHRICFEFIFRSIRWNHCCFTVAVFFPIHFATDNRPFGLVRVGMTWNYRVRKNRIRHYVFHMTGLVFPLAETYTAFLFVYCVVCVHIICLFRLFCSFIWWVFSIPPLIFSGYFRFRGCHLRVYAN